MDNKRLGLLRTENINEERKDYFIHKRPIAQPPPVIRYMEKPDAKVGTGFFKQFTNKRGCFVIFCFRSASSKTRSVILKPTQIH